ncbi:DUF2635 domain-containing protein [Limnobaculum xujianqingii]|uniref:DUF2635 domain-containing protein n=1 Tax=Limnobaculum xujianqingii TaxID=2738837 RepID=UPI00112734DA|nr:DUF2635 domain-containing protein [Limnobaculum xujianqingii]
MTTLLVKARAGLKIPLEHNPKKYITTEPVPVESSAYYRRALKDGDLVLCQPESTKPVNEPAPGEPAHEESTPTVNRGKAK